MAAAIHALERLRAGGGSLTGTSRTDGILARIALLGAGLALAAGCRAIAPSPNTSGPSGSGGPVPPSAEPILGIDWGRAASVERPPNYLETVPPDYPGKHPILRIAGQAMMVDVAALPGGGYVAVGFVPPDWTPAAWTSTDGETWRFDSIGDSAFTFPVALAVGTDGTVVAVGRSRDDPVAWTSLDGGLTWERHSVPRDGPLAERMTSVIATSTGFVAGGSAGPELLDRDARFWTSTDGATWSPVPADRATLAGAEVRAITAFDGGYVAVGVVGTAQEQTASVAWTSPDGASWTRIDDPAFAGGIAVAVVPAPFGGLVAVGSDLDRREAVAWTSSDGRAWTRAPSEASRIHSGGYAWMTDVVAIGDIVLAIGEYQGLQRGIGTSWVSRDGRTWQPATQAPVQQQAEFYAITAGGPGAIAVGSFGAPDSYVPNVWLTPDR